MPCIKSEGLEYGKGKCRKGSTDDTHADDLFLSLIHDVGKGTKKK
jgi:hypothetical protein